MSVVFIGLVKNHHSMYFALLKQFEANGKRITFLTREEDKGFYSSLNIDFIDIGFFTGPTISILKKKKRFIDSFKTLIIDELFDGFNGSWSLQFKCERKITFLHNVNRVFNPTRVKDLKSIVRRVLLKRYFNQFSEYIVVAPNVKDYLACFVKRESVFIVPFNNGHSTREKKGASEIVITIPGMVTSERRNYLDVLSSFEAYLSINQDSKIIIKLLGRMRSDEIEIKVICDKINSVYGDKVHYFEYFIPDIEFEHELKCSDLIMSNLEVFVKREDSLEVYGISKESGITFILFKYGIPGIIPYNQVVYGGLENQTLRFTKGGDLQEIFRSLDFGTVDFHKLTQIAKSNQSIINEEFLASMEILANSLKD